MNKFRMRTFHPDYDNHLYFLRSKDQRRSGCYDRFSYLTGAPDVMKRTVINIFCDMQ